MQARPTAVTIILVLCLVTACGGGTAATTTTEALTTSSGAPVTSTSTTRSSSAVTMDAPEEIGAGSEFIVTWVGPNNGRDYITIVAIGAAEGTFDSYFYTEVGPEGTLLAPIEVGDYEIRYVDGVSEATVERITVTVVPFVIVLTPPATIDAGTEFDVEWSGPDGTGDYVTVVPVGSPEGTYESYFDTKTGTPGTLVAPVEEAASFEIRYVSGATSKTLGSVAVTVTPLAVTLEAPESVAAGSSFEVVWTGPNGPGDYVTIVPVDSPAGTYLDWKYTTYGSPLTLTAPDEEGDYEIRYASDRVTEMTFAAIPIDVR